LNIKISLDKNINNLDDLIIINRFINLFKDIIIVFDYNLDNEEYIDKHIEAIIGNGRDDIIKINNNYSYDENKLMHMYYIIKSVDDVKNLDYYKAYKIRQLFIDVDDEEEINKILNMLITNYPFLANQIINKELIWNKYLYIQINSKLDVYLTDYSFEEIEQFKVGNLRDIKNLDFELLEFNKREFFTDKNKCMYCNNIFCKASPIRNFKNLFNRKYIDEKQCNRYKYIEKYFLANNQYMLYNILTNYLVPFNTIINSFEKLNESLNKIEDRLYGIEKRCDIYEK
jgi:hypothetical protein